MNLTTIQSRTAKFCGDPDQTRFSSGYVDAINDAQKQFTLDTKSLFKDVAYTTVSGTSTYALPTDFLYEDTVTYNGLPLDPVSRHTLYTLYPDTDWTLLEGTPKCYMVDPEEASLVVRLIPIPQEAKPVSMRYYPLPTDVSSGSDVILNSSTLMTQFHLGIAAYAAWIILTSETITPEIVVKRNELLRIYTDAVEKAINTFKNTASAPLRLRGTNPR